LKLKFIGGCKQIGGQTVALEHDNNVYLFDYGILMENKPTLPPLDFSVKDLKAIFLTHAHLDHSGGLPLFFSGTKSVKLIMTPPTRVLSKILLKDMLKLSEYYLPFGNQELNAMLNQSTILRYQSTDWVSLNGIKFLMLDAGHIPGSTSFVCEINNKRILYTGDVNHRNTMLLNGMVNNFPKIDYVIMETTYGSTDHPPRKDIEVEFVESINKIIIENEGTVLIPAFGVGRSQEVMCILYNYNIQSPIFIDGMARTVCRTLLNHLDNIRDSELYKRAIRKSFFITTGKQKFIERQNAASTSGVIISPSGMLKGGTAMFYSERLINDNKNAIYLVSFQLPNTLGRQILDTQIWKDGKTKIKAEVKHFPLSSHSGKSELLNMVDTIVKKSNNNTQFFLIHGDEENIKHFSDILNDRNIQSFIPNLGEEFQIT